MAEDVKLRISGDTSELEKAFDSLLKNIQNKADRIKLGPSASKAAPGAESLREASQTSRAVNQRVREEKAGLELINRELAKKKALIDDLTRQQAVTVKGLEKERELQIQIKREKEGLHRTEQVARIQEVNYRKSLEALNRASGTKVAGQGGGNAPGGATNFAGIMSALGVPIGIGGIIGASKLAEYSRRFVAEAANRARVAEAQGYQVQGQGGQRITSLINGGASEEVIFNSQRLQAAQTAKETVDARYGTGNNDWLENKLIGQQTAGALQHGQFRQATRAFLGHLGFEGSQKDFETQKNLEQAQYQAEQFDALKNGPQGAVRTASADKYLRDFRRNLDFQRQTGLTEDQYRGQFLGGVHRAGFADEQGMGMASGIMGAGGSTRAATGNAAFGLQMQRQFDLTNADQVIGAISGQLGSSQMTKEGLIKIQAEGTRLGLNQSDFREENRKFVEAAAGVINQSNVTSGAGIDQLISGFSRFMGSNTITGIQAGQNAYQAYQQASNVQSGPSAVMRAGGLLKSPLKSLSASNQAALFTMNAADVNVDDQGIKQMAASINKSPQFLVDEYHKIQGSSVTQRKETDDAISRLRALYQNRSGPLSEGERAKRISTAEGQVENLLRIEPNAQGLVDSKSIMELGKALARDDQKTVSQLLLQEQTKRQAETGQTGRAGDETEKLQAQSAKLANELFSQIKNSIVPAAEAAKQFANDVNSLTMALSRGNSAQKQAAIEQFQSKYPGVVPTEQPSAGPPANGAGQAPAGGKY
jgi:hypothetical protein